MFRRGKLNFLHTKDDRLKIFTDRINFTERHLIDLCSGFSNCTRKLAKYRDSYDELSKSIRTLAEEDEINESLDEGLKQLSNAVTILGDFMDLQVNRMELKVVNEITQFENLCKSTRDNLRTAVINRDKEVLKQRQLLEIRSKFSGNNSAAESELLKAKMEVNRGNKEIDGIINHFEERKLNDLKTILIDFILLQMKYHSKCLEVLTASFHDMQNIDEKEDYEHFQKILKTHSNGNQSARRSTANSARRSMSMESLDRERLVSPLRRNPRLSKSTKNLSSDVNSQSEENLDEDEDGDGSETEEEDDDDDQVELNEQDDYDDNTEVENEDNGQDNVENFTGRSGTEESEDSSHYDTDKKVKVWKRTSGGTNNANKSQASSIKKPFQVSSSTVKYPFKATTASSSANPCPEEFGQGDVPRVRSFNNNRTFTVSQSREFTSRKSFQDRGGGDCEGEDERLSLDLSEDASIYESRVLEKDSVSQENNSRVLKRRQQLASRDNCNRTFHVNSTI